MHVNNFGTTQMDTQEADFSEYQKPIETCSESLRSEIEQLEKIIDPLFFENDTKTLHFQHHHQVITSVSVISGTAAVLLVILQMSNIYTGPAALILEITAVLAALLAVISGKIWKVHEHWLLYRHRAERLKLLFYRALIDSMDKKEVADECSCIQSVNTEGGVWEWIQMRGIIWNPPAEESRGDICGVSEYYMKSRLDIQIDYFNQRAGEIRKADRWTRLLPSSIFFFSLAIALLHILIDLTGDGDETLSTGMRIGVILILCAAALPVVGAGIRTFRGAREYSRNLIRYSLILDQLKKRKAALSDLFLCHCISGSGMTAEVAAAMTDEMHASEEMLEFEHQEWLRLMMDAEWYG